MKTCLINGISAKSGGGRSILTNFLTSISKKNVDIRYIVVVPKGHNYERFESANIIILPYNDKGFGPIKQMFYYFIYINKIVANYNVSLIFNLSDVIVPSNTRQLLLFDWPYAVYPESTVWKKMPSFEFYYRKLKLMLFKKYISKPLVIYAQTESVKSRLEKYYPSIKEIDILPNAVSLDNLDGGSVHFFDLPQNRQKLLCLSKYYVHKNIEIFIPIARKIKKENLPFSIILTIEENQHKNVKSILEIIKDEDLQNILINVGEVSMQHVPSLYQQCDALILPTLLESFSGTYVEAMFHEKPIFTSNMDFARDVCGNAAIYFDPLDSDEIIESIKLISNKNIIENLKNLGIVRLRGFKNWKQVSDKILIEIKKYI